MWPTKLYSRWHDFTERDAKLRKLYAAHSLAKIRNDKVRCRDLMQQIRRCGG